jgi:hypothetical protein
VQEISSLKTTPEIRFAMLESLRMRVQMVIEGLSHLFLNKPLSLPPEIVKVATLAQALQKHQTNGYKVIIKQLMSAPETIQNNLLMGLAIYHAVKGFTFFLLRSYQLYLPIPPKIWQEMHSLYHLAEQRGLIDTTLEDKGNKYQVESNIVIAYLRAVMLGCSKPNKLRQADLDKTFHALELWLSHIDFHHDVLDNNKSLFVIPMNEDSPPIYRAQIKHQIDATYRHISTNNLVNQLTNHLRGETTNLEIPNELSRELIEHLIVTWSMQQKRAFDRNKTTEALEICIGLRDTHYFAANCTPFKELLDPYASNISEADFNPFLSGGPITRDKLIEVEDIWDEVDSTKTSAGTQKITVSTANIERQIRENSATKEVNDHFSYKLKVVNSSPGGFCLEISTDNPEHIHTGEIIGIKDKIGDNWSIGIIRWLRQMKSCSQIGVELLSPSAISYGASIIKKTGVNTEYLRTLLLPELKFINQPPTLITTQMLFSEGAKIILNKSGNMLQAQLTKRIFSTSSINQFEFRLLDRAEEAANAKEINNDNTFWGEL